MSSKGVCYQVIPPYDCDRVCDGLQLGGGGNHWGDIMIMPFFDLVMILLDIYTFFKEYIDCSGETSNLWSDSEKKVRSEREANLLAKKKVGGKSVTRNVAILSGDRVVTAYCKTAEDLQLEQVENASKQPCKPFLAFLSTVSRIKRLLKLFDWKLMCTLNLEYCGYDLKPICVSDYLGCFVHSPPRPLFLM